MKKIVLLGDSIRQIGYGTKLPEIIGEQFTVWQPKENCRFSKHTLRGVMCEWSKDIEGSDIIHWNNGLWDATELFGDGTFTTEEEYISDCTRIARILKKITPNVIFATTTPVWDEFEYTHNDKIQRFNEIIVPVLKAEGLVINDLYSAVATDIHKYVKECDKIHLSDEGIDLCAKLVAEKIKSFKG